MPKKYNNRAKYTKLASTTYLALTSSTSSHHGTVSNPAPASSVNDLIQHLRRSQGLSAAEGAKSDANLTPTVHPSLRALLQLPETQAPPPRMQNNGRRRARGPAGPPPPKSWLADSIHAPRHLQKSAFATGESSRIKSRLDRLPGTFLPHERSLMHQTLKALATNWLWHIDYDQYYLATLPDRYKEALLSYIVVYNPVGITLRGLHMLFLDDDILEDATGSATITHLDLSSALGPHLTSKELLSYFSKPAPATDAIASIPDAWDDSPPRTPNALSPSDPSEQAILSGPTVPRFPALTHLSLACPQTPAPWRTLLALLPLLKTLTHLSLAHFPVPSLTPNAATATTNSPIGQVPYGASTVYSATDGDWSEAVGVLRRLGKGTLCLRWLELDGCGPWVEALGWEPPPLSRDGEEEESLGAEEGKGTTAAEGGGRQRSRRGVDWNGCWRGVETVRISPGWVPEGVLERRQYGKDAKRRLGAWVEDGWDVVEDVGWDVEDERDKYAMKVEAKRWLEEQRTVKMMENVVCRIRRQAGGKAVRFERGEWSPEIEDVIHHKVLIAIDHAFTFRQSWS